MSGNWATGMRESASKPASEMTMAMTIAMRGRSMKCAEIMRYLPAGVGEAGAGAATDIWPHPLNSLHHDLLARLQPLGHARDLGCRLSQFHPALLGDVLVVDDEHVVALLVGQDRGPRNSQHLERLDGLEARR